jgi:hypothetical protein
VVSVKRDNEGADVFYVFEVSEWWKRRVEPQITIHSGTTCSFEADVGERYVFFLKQNKQGMYDTATCVGNRPEAKVRPLLDYLRTVKPENEGIQGGQCQSNGRPLAGSVVCPNPSAD